MYFFINKVFKTTLAACVAHSSPPGGGHAMGAGTGSGWRPAGTVGKGKEPPAGAPPGWLWDSEDGEPCRSPAPGRGACLRPHPSSRAAPKPRPRTGTRWAAAAGTGGEALGTLAEAAPRPRQLARAPAFLPHSRRAQLRLLPFPPSRPLPAVPLLPAESPPAVVWRGKRAVSHLLCQTHWGQGRDGELDPFIFCFKQTARTCPLPALSQ